MVLTRSQGIASPENDLPLRSRRTSSNNNKTPIKKSRIVVNVDEITEYTNANGSILGVPETPSSVTPTGEDKDEDTIVVIPRTEPQTDIDLPPETGTITNNTEGEIFSQTVTPLENKGNHKRFASEEPETDEFYSALEDHLHSFSTPSNSSRHDHTTKNSILPDDDAGKSGEDADNDDAPPEVTTTQRQKRSTPLSTPRRTPRSVKKQKLIPPSSKGLEKTSSQSSTGVHSSETNSTNPVLPNVPFLREIVAEAVTTADAVATDDVAVAPNEAEDDVSMSDLVSPSIDATLSTSSSTIVPIQQSQTESSPPIEQDSLPSSAIPSTVPNPDAKAALIGQSPSSIPLLPVLETSHKSNEPILNLPPKPSISLHGYRQSILGRHRTQPWHTRKIRFI